MNQIYIEGGLCYNIVKFKNILFEMALILYDLKILEELKTQPLKYRDVTVANVF